ncbi:hypothetical protein F5Y06DRAFT_295388 [Hypoxylon sp. FL0890]|nr:hypothetical protein F5Y06DRAFT_295388 [Hypoxylon sp. FL0890]
MVFALLTTMATPTTLAPRATSSLDHNGTPPVAALTTVWLASEGCFPISTRPVMDIDVFSSLYPDCASPGCASYFKTYSYTPAICPSEYTVGCSRYGEFQGPSVEPTETAMLCVMSLTLTTATSGGGAGATETGPSSGTTVTMLSALNKNQGGLSTGAHVGIGVGEGLLGLLTIGLVVFFILRYRKRRVNGQGTSQLPFIQQLPPDHVPVQQHPHVLGPGQQGQPAQGYPHSIYPGNATYVDPKTSAVAYYSLVPQPTEFSGTAIKGSNLSLSQAAPSVVGLPVGHHASTGAAAVVEMPGNERVTRSIASIENPQAQQEMTHLTAEQTKLEGRRTRLMELAELDEEVEEQIRTRMRQLQQSE